MNITNTWDGKRFRDGDECRYLFRATNRCIESSLDDDVGSLQYYWFCEILMFSQRTQNLIGKRVLDLTYLE